MDRLLVPEVAELDVDVARDRDLVAGLVTSIEGDFGDRGDKAKAAQADQILEGRLYFILVSDQIKNNLLAAAARDQGRRRRAIEAIWDIHPCRIPAVSAPEGDTVARQRDRVHRRGHRRRHGILELRTDRGPADVVE